MRVRHLFKILVPLATTVVVTTACNNNVGGINKYDNQSTQKAGLNQHQKIVDMLHHNTLWQQHLSIRENYLTQTQEPPIHMGDGFDGRTGIGKGYNCLANFNAVNKIQISNPSSDIRFSSVTSAAELSSMLGFGFSAKGGYGPFSASANAHYEESMKNTRQDMHFNYYQSERAEVSYVIPSSGNNALRPDARDLLVNGGGLDLFTDVCGDSFIDNAYIGALLFVDIAIHFDSATAKSEFEASIKGKAMGIASVAAEFKKSEAFSASHATISVQAMQNGGDVAKFAEIFGTKDTQTHNYAVVDCAGGDIDMCVNMINGVIGYAQTSFAKSVDFTKPDNLYVYTYSAKTYKSIAIQASLPPLTQAEQDANDYISNSIYHDRMMLDYLNTYKKQKNLISLMSPASYNKLNNAIQAYSDMVDKYRNYQVLDACYGDTNHLEERCLKAADVIKNYLHKDYKDAINFANNLGNTIVANRYDSIHPYSYSFVPLDATCNDLGECQGHFALYKNIMTEAGEKTTFEYATCLVDTTSDNYYFKNLYKEHVGKIDVCTPIDDKHAESYIKRGSKTAGTAGDTTTGVWGRYPNGHEVDDPVNQMGINTEMDFSDSSRLLYNPI